MTKFDWIFQITHSKDILITYLNFYCIALQVIRIRYVHYLTLFCSLLIYRIINLIKLSWKKFKKTNVIFYFHFSNNYVKRNWLQLVSDFAHFTDQLLQKHPPTPKPRLLKLDVKIQLLIQAVVHKVWKFCLMTYDLWLYQQPQHLPGIKNKIRYLNIFKYISIYSIYKLKSYSTFVDFSWLR